MSVFAFKYHTLNIGDDIQTLAAMGLSPPIELFMFRDDMMFEVRKHRNSRLHGLINGWYSQSPSTFIPEPGDHFNPLCISMHLSNKYNSSLQEMLSHPNFRDFFKYYQPIGCRDLETKHIFEEHNVEAYFSGCATLTLRVPSVKKSNLVCMVDCENQLPRHLFRDATFLNVAHTTPELLQDELKFNPPVKAIRLLHKTEAFHRWKRRQAHRLLNIYKSARLVVTSRLHCVFPCIAMGTDVLFVHEDPSDPRFTGYQDVLNIVHPEDIARFKSLEDIEAAVCRKNKVVDQIQSSIRLKANSFFSEL